MKTWLTAVLLGVLAGTGAEGAAGEEAQTSGAGSSPAEARTAAEPPLAEVVVSAQKRIEPLQKVAAAASVLSGEEIASLGVTDLAQISNLSTGVNVEPVRTDALVYIRGVGQSVTSPNADPSVAVNLNGVYLPSDIAGTAFFDVSRIEILPGPQGTLYGRNSTGGVVNLIGRLPAEQFATDGLFEVGNYNRRQVVAGLDMPFTQQLAVRVAGTTVRHDGYLSNGEDDQDVTAVKGAVSWQPAAGTRITGTLINTLLGGIGTTLDNQPPAASYGCGTRCASFDPRTQGYFNDAHTLQSNWEINQELGHTLALTYVGGYAKIDLDNTNTQNAGPPLLPLSVEEHISSQSHELRLSANTETLASIFGLYYYQQSAFYSNQVANFRGGPFDAGPPAAYTYKHVGYTYSPFNAAGHGYAGFGQLSYSVLESVRLVAGLRFSHTAKSINGYNDTVSGAGIQTVLNPYTGSNSLNRLDWKAGIEYDIAPHSMAYANFSTGFNAGGFSSAPTTAVNGVLEPAESFKPTHLDAYTAGVKNQFLDGHLTANLEGFYYNYENYQVFTRAPNGQAYVFTADKSTIYGAQVDFALRATPDDELSIGVTALHAIANTLAVGASDYNGFALPYSPKFANNVSYQHSFNLAADAHLRALANFKYTTSRWTTFNHAPGSQQGANPHTDLSLGYFAAADRWSVSAFVRNLEDRTVKTTCAPSVTTIPGAATGCFYEPPRTYGISVGFRY